MFAAESAAPFAESAGPPSGDNATGVNATCNSHAEDDEPTGETACHPAAEPPGETCGEPLMSSQQRPSDDPLKSGETAGESGETAGEPSPAVGAVSPTGGGGGGVGSRVDLAA